MGHIPEAKYSEMHEAYMNGELTTKEFVDWYNIMIRNIEKNNLIGVVDLQTTRKISIVYVGIIWRRYI